MSKKTFVREVGPYKELHRDEKTGIAWVENGSTGGAHTCHPSIHYTGSVRGMKSNGGWRKDDTVLRSHGYKYNVNRLIVNPDDPYDIIAAKACRCVGCEVRRITHMDRMIILAKLIKHPEPEPKCEYTTLEHHRQELKRLLLTAPDGTLEELQSEYGLPLEEVTTA